MSSQTIITCGITVIVTNNTGQGSITFNSLSFFDSFNPTGFPPVVLNELPNGSTNTILIAAYQQQWVVGPYGPLQGPSTADGTATFNFPNGELLNISWDLDAFDNDNPVPTLVPGTGYYITGLTNPQVNGANYTFTLNVSPQSAK